MKAVYIGAGVDLIPFIVYDSIKTFIYVDSQPISEFGMIGWCDKEMYRHSFLDRLDKVMNQNKLFVNDMRNNYVEYKTEDDRCIKYFVNTPFPEKVDMTLHDEIVSSDTLIICGYHPPSSIINMMPLLQHIICDNHTDYAYDEDNDNVVNYLYKTTNEYNYYLMKETTCYEYWKNENIQPSIKENYKIEEYSTITPLEINRQLGKISLVY
jgi:hypothetical protein